MLVELLEGLTDLARKSGLPNIVKLGPEPDNVYALAHNGQVEFRKAQPADRKHIAYDVPTVFSLIEEAVELDNKVKLWYSRDGIVAVLDDDSDRRNSISVKLDLSPQIKLLQQMEATPRSYNQRDLILLLRTTLARCLAQCPDLIGIVRQVKWKTGTDGESTVQHGRTSIGKSIIEEVTGLKTIPEVVTLEVPVFANMFTKIVQPIRVAIEPDAGTQSFRLIPLPLEIEEALEQAERRLDSVIAELIPDALYNDQHETTKFMMCLGRP